MQALIRPHRAPENGLLRCQLFLFGIMRLAVINMKMDHPFEQANHQREKDRGAHDYKNNNGSKGMNARVLGTARMHIGAAPRQHLGGLQEEIGKKMLDLQEAEQKQNGSDNSWQIVPLGDLTLWNHTDFFPAGKYCIA